MQWLYISGDHEQKMVDEAKLASLVREGTIRPDTQVWSNQLADWTQAALARPDLFRPIPPKQSDATLPMRHQQRPAPAPSKPAPAPSSGASEAEYRKLGGILAKASEWLQLMGVIYFLGFFYIIPIFMGIKCFRIGRKAKAAAASGEYSELRTAIEEVKNLFVLQGVVVLIAIVLNVVFFIISVASH